MIGPSADLSQQFAPIAAEEGFDCDWQVPGELFYFQGHFPGQPILPAVGILDLTEACIRKFLAREWAISTVADAKFTAPIAPEAKVCLQARYSEGEWRVVWLSDQGQKFASLRLA